MIHTRDTLFVNEKGHLTIGGADCVDLAEQFGTPLYVFDERYIRRMMRIYQDTINAEYDGHGLVLYASKAFSCEAIYAIARQEGIGVDVVSGGELYTAKKAGFPAEKITMHGNNKLPHEISEALSCGVGMIVVDAHSEADLIEAEAKKTRDNTGCDDPHQSGRRSAYACLCTDGNPRFQIRVLGRKRCRRGDDRLCPLKAASSAQRIPLSYWIADL